MLPQLGGVQPAETTKSQLTEQLNDVGAPDRIRTCDLCLRRATLSPTELQVGGRATLFKRRKIKQRRGEIAEISTGTT